MLHVEQPDAHRRREHDNRQMDEQERRQAHVQDQQPAASRRPALVVIVLSHGIRPLRMKPIGSRFSNRNT